MTESPRENLIELMDEYLVPGLRALGIEVDQDDIWDVSGEPWDEAEQDYREEPVLDDSVVVWEEPEEEEDILTMDDMWDSKYH